MATRNTLRKAPRKGRRLGLRRALLVFLILALGVLGAGQLGGDYPTLDLANVALVPGAIAAIVVAILLAWLTKRWAKRCAYGVIIAIAAYLMIPPPSAMGTCDVDAARVTVAWLNLQGSTQPQPIVDWLEQERPDIVGFGELHSSVEPTRTVLAERYAHAQSCLANGRCSTILYTANPLLGSQPLSRGDVQNRKTLSAARMTIADSDGAPLHVIAAHLSRPPYMQRQREELTQLQLLLEDTANTVMIGDLNMVRRMQGLRNFAQGSGFATTPADRSTWPLWYKGTSVTPFVQIDHVLAGQSWQVEALRSSDDLGSDHRGIVADLCRVG